MGPVEKGRCVAMVVSNRYDPDPRVHKEALSLARAGWTVTIYAFDRMHERCERETLEHGLTLQRIRVAKSPVGDLVATARGLRDFKQEVKRRILENPPEILHCHDQDTCSVGLWWKLRGARRAGLGKGVFVFDAHDLYWTWLRLPDPGSTWRKAGAHLLRAQGFVFARSADLVITVTEERGGRPGLAELFRGWGSRTEVIWNAPYAPADIPPLPKTFTLGWVGNIRETAPFEWFVRAIEILPEDRRPALFVAGGGVASERVHALLRSAADRLGFPLEIEGAFSISQIPTLMERVSVQACFYESARGQVSRGIPTKLLDSVAYGRLAIGNSGVLFGDLIEHNGWGATAEEGNPQAIAGAIETVREMTAKRDVHEVASSAWHWETEGARLVDIYTRFDSTKPIREATGEIPG